MRSTYQRGNVFVANLPTECSADELAEAFDSCGMVLSAYVAHDPETGNQLRYGFVNLAPEKAVAGAISAMNGTELKGSRLDVRASERKIPVKKPGFAAAPRRPLSRPSFNAEPRQDYPARAEYPSRSEYPPRSEHPSRAEHVHGDAADGFGRSYMAVPPRKTTPTFQVERRTLPRRSQG